jgi:two-component system cell cycle sensor histidine kinase/response regulator CckA
LSTKNKSDNYYSSNNHNSSRQKEDANDDSGDRPLARLLIVDDDSEIVQVLKSGLQKNGFLVDAFTNPEEALQSFKSNAEKFCLVVSDIRMPALSGIQLARKVKEINPNVKVVLMTAFEIRGNEFSKVFPSMHVDGFVQKPIGISDLTNKILSIIGEAKRSQGERKKDES